MLIKEEEEIFLDSVEELYEQMDSFVRMNGHGKNYQFKRENKHITLYWGHFLGFGTPAIRIREKNNPNLEDKVINIAILDNDIHGQLFTEILLTDLQRAYHQFIKNLGNDYRLPEKWDSARQRISSVDYKDIILNMKVSQSGGELPIYYILYEKWNNTTLQQKCGDSDALKTFDAALRHFQEFYKYIFSPNLDFEKLRLMARVVYPNVELVYGRRNRQRVGEYVIFKEDFNLLFKEFDMNALDIDDVKYRMEKIVMKGV